MTTATVDRPVEMYLTSIWKYEDAGVQRVLAALREQHPKGQFEFEPSNAWFKVTCDAGNVADVQASFRNIHIEMEGDLQIQDTPAKVSATNKWLKVPAPRELPSQPETIDQPIEDRQCPTVFDKYSYTQVWKRVKDETPDAITIHTFMSTKDIASISEFSGVFIQCDSADRLAYLGGPSKQSINQASTMLDNMFHQYLHTIPPPKHILYAETDGMYHIDTRYMAHVNETMLTSTILDPGQYPDTKMQAAFKAIFSKAVCLRICQFDPFKRTEVSFFGPRVKPVFDGQALKYPKWFTNDEYAPKALGVTAPREEPITNENQSTHALTLQETGEKSLMDQLDLLFEAKDREKKLELAVGKLPPENIDLLSSSDKHGYQMRLLWEFVNNPSPAPSRRSSEMKLVTNSTNNKAPGEDKLITTLDDDMGVTNLIDIAPTAPIDYESPADEQQLISLALETTPAVSCSSRIVKSNTHMSAAFLKTLYHSLRQLVADLPYRQGRIRLQAELGRIYMMDANPSGLACNGPGEPATGWSPIDLVNRLDTVCVSSGSVMFTKALSIFSNDIEHMICTGTNTGTMPPRWRLHEKRIVYEFKCQRFVLPKDGMAKPQSPFVVEIDGSVPGTFKYSLRRLEDSRPPIWVHCIRRHWDVRVTVMHSPSDRLEQMYGDFARGLLQSMVVPPGPIGVGAGPRFQIGYDYREKEGMSGGLKFCTKVMTARVRHVGRHISEDGASFLDISWNRHMKLERKADNDSRTGVLRGTAAADDPARGMFSSWYEVSVVSTQAEAAFCENETLAVGGSASGWSSTATQDCMFHATVGPALELVKQMDGVGVLIDNGQAETMQMPPMQQNVAPTTGRFW